MVGPGFSAFLLGLVAGWSAVFLRWNGAIGARAWLVPLLWLLWAPALFWISRRFDLPLMWIAAGAVLGAVLHQLLVLGIEGRKAR